MLGRETFVTKRILIITAISKKIIWVWKSFTLTLKRLGDQFDPPLFSWNFVVWKGDVPWFFVTFNIIKKIHIFLKISLKFIKLFRKYEDLFPKFQVFLPIFWIFNICLLEKRLMMSAYNKWCQHFFSFNLL